MVARVPPELEPLLEELLLLPPLFPPLPLMTPDGAVFTTKSQRCVPVLQVWPPLQPSFVQSGRHWPEGQKLPVGQSASVRQLAKALPWHVPATQASPVAQSLSSTQLPDIPWQAESAKLAAAVIATSVRCFDIIRSGPRSKRTPDTKQNLRQG